ncbi:cation:proton antiporter [Desulfococcus sp.]|uniref:cation:proton antiporter n=1 Tax=Desulfococcus sp. TaxID=2025834 RepID=UPI003593D95A
MTAFTLTWMAFPFGAGFAVSLLPRMGRHLALFGGLFSALFAVRLFAEPAPTTLSLIGRFGVTLMLDPLAGFFILTNALVTAAVVLFCWRGGRTSFFFAQVLMLHGSVNAAFSCSDFISLYVALEVLGIPAFLLIAHPRTDRAVWVALRYLLVGNVAMLFYLVGAVLVYSATHSFRFEGMGAAPPEAVALILTGLLVKGGVFAWGWWLPLTHAESESPVSALMSGIVVKAGLFSLVRLATLVPSIDPIIRILGVGTALLGAGCAVLEKDAKRLLAYSTISQMGFILAAPEVGGFYALTHGLVKSALFLIVGTLPSRDLGALRHQPLPSPVWAALVTASFSISGFPLLSGFGAKVLTMKNLLPWQVMAMNLAALGTATSFAKFIFLPHRKPAGREGSAGGSGFWTAMGLLLGGLLAANTVYYDAYTLENVAKPLLTIAMAWALHGLAFRHAAVKVPRGPERLEHLTGMMSLSLILLFWMALA